MNETPAGTESETSNTSLPLRVLAPAKINLHLRVGRTAPDGFHPLLTWMCTVSLFDTLELRPGPADGGALSMTCDDARLPCDETNLVIKGGLLVAKAISANRDEGFATREGGLAAKDLASVTIVLKKLIPSGAGLGGGSSDGASAMLALNGVWRGALSNDELAKLSANVGSDLPFFFRGPSAVCTGRGEIVKAVTPPVVAKWAMLALPDTVMPTPAVYRKFDEMGLGDGVDLTSEPDWDAWSKLSANKLLGLLVNDLEAPAFAIDPKLGELRKRIELQVDRPVRMSGSGSSLFTLFDRRDEVELAVKQVGRQLGLRVLAVEVAPQT